jgi:hypothetical protein
MYDLGDALPTGEPTALDPGSSLLVSGPAFSGQQDVLFDVLAAGGNPDEGALVVTTDLAGERVRRAYRDRTGGGDDLYVVDARGGATGTQSGGERLQTVSSPGDLTGIGINVVRCLRALRDRGVDRVRIGLHSISTLVQYLDHVTVFQFLHTLVGRVQATDHMLVASLVDGPDERTFATVGSMFDVLLQIREQDDGLESRVSLQTGRLPWMPFSSV